MSDAALLAALDSRCFPESERWSEQLWADQLGNELNWTKMLWAGSAPMAAITIQVLFDTAELFRVCVDPAHRGVGLGRQLTQAALAEASRRGAERMLLEVRSDNSAALGLYTGAGFAPIAERADYYGPGADAVVMERVLTSH